MIAIIDYGMGNLRSVQKGIERAGFDAIVTRDLAQIQSARGLVLPGVGAFSACMAEPRQVRTCRVIRESVRQAQTISWDLSRFPIALFRERRVRQTDRDSISSAAKWSAFTPTKISKCRIWAGIGSRNNRTRRF